jgi:hypothetical protein
MRRNVVLIDFESVQPESIEALNHDFYYVLLFCGANQTKVPLEIAATLQKLGPRAQYIRIAGVGPNALDFHIAYYIGRLAAEDPSTAFHIVSRDKGFDPLIQHLKAQKYLAIRSESVPAIRTAKNTEKRPPSERAEAFIAKLKAPKAAKPKTEKALGSAIKSHFQPGVEEAEVAQILRAMVLTGFISIEAGKISYAESAT